MSMGGHQLDAASGRSARAGSRSAATPGEPATSKLRSIGLVGGFVLALTASLAVFLTDNPQYLRLAVIAAAWAFVLAAFLAGRRRAEQLAAADREEVLRRSYEHELEQETAAHREYELELENHLRRETEDSMRSELSGLRAEIAELSLLRHEVARVARLGTDLPALSGLRADLAGLSALREDILSLTALREDVASLAALRQDMSAVTELKTDVDRLRAELSEQFNGEMLVERIMLRTQAIRRPAEQFPGEPGAPRTTEVPAVPWEDDRPPRELTGGRPAVQLDDLLEPRRPEPLRVERPANSPGGLVATPGQSPDAAPAPSREEAAPAAPSTTAFPLAAPAAVAAPAPDPAASPTPLEWLVDRSLVEPADLAAPRRSRHSADDARPAAVGEARGRMPGDVLPPLPPRRRRNDEPFDGRTEERPVAPATNVELARPSPTPRPTPYPRTAPQPVTPAPAVGADADSAGHQRLAEILAESGGQPPPGGRRHRRYRDEAENGDDVLARVLRQD